MTSIANATHLICCRSTPPALWNRTTSESTDPASRIRKMNPASTNQPIADSTAGT